MSQAGKQHIFRELLRKQLESTNSCGLKLSQIRAKLKLKKAPEQELKDILDVVAVRVPGKGECQYVLRHRRASMKRCFHEHPGHDIVNGLAVRPRCLLSRLPYP